MEIIVKGRIWN